MKKLISVIMAVAMMISMGVVAFADVSIDTEEKLQAAINAGGTVVLSDNIAVTGTITVPAGVNVTLDLNGKVLSKEVTEEITASNQLILNKGNLTIIDSSGNNSGKISYYFNGTANSAWSYAVVAISNQQAILTIKSGTIESLSTATNVYKFTVDNLTNGNGGDSVVNVEGGVITAAKGGSIRGFANSTTNTCQINISGGEILGQVWLQDPNTNKNIGSMNITGGEITNNAEGVNAVYLYGLGDASGMDVSIGGDAVINGTTYLTSVDTTASFNAEITGGTFEDSVWVCTWDKNSVSTNLAAISGGTFSNEIPADNLAYGFVQDENGAVVSAYASISCDLDGKTFKANEAYEFTVTVERKDYEAPLSFKLNLDPNGLVKLETSEEGGWVEVSGNEIIVTGIVGDFVQYDFRVTYSEEGEHYYGASVGYYSEASNMFGSFDSIYGPFVVKGIADNSSSGSSSAPSSRPSRDDDDDDDDEGITEITGKDEPGKGEENPNTGAPIMLPIATAVAALCGLYISKKK